MPRPGRRAPADRHAAVVRGKQIEPPIDRDAKAQPGAGAKVEHAHAALRPVGVLEQLDAGDLCQGTGPLIDFERGRFRPNSSTIPPPHLHGNVLASSRIRLAQRAGGEDSCGHVPWR